MPRGRPKKEQSQTEQMEQKPKRQYRKKEEREQQEQQELQNKEIQQRRDEWLNRKFKYTVFRKELSKLKPMSSSDFVDDCFYLIAENEEYIIMDNELNKDITKQFRNKKRK